MRSGLERSEGSKGRIKLGFCCRDLGESNENFKKLIYEVGDGDLGVIVL